MIKSVSQYSMRKNAILIARIKIRPKITNQNGKHFENFLDIAASIRYIVCLHSMYYILTIRSLKDLKVS